MRRHSNLIPFGVAAIAGVVLLALIGVPVWSYLPFIAIFAICPLMMVFMMRGMNHGGGESKSDDIDEEARTPSGHRH